MSSYPIEDKLINCPADTQSHSHSLSRLSEGEEHPKKDKKWHPPPHYPPHSTSPTQIPGPYSPQIDSATIAAIGVGSMAALAAAISLSDPEKRRRLQAEEVGGGDKEVVKDYFNKSGFERWKKIYRETDDVNRVQRDIRLGHSKTVENVIKMLTDEGPLQGVSVCDAGWVVVTAADISAAMVAEAEKQAKKQLQLSNGFSAGPSLDGKYDTLVCLDVLTHYPQSKADRMIAHLASLAENRLLISFAPKTLYYDVLKRIGELFPGPSKATRAYLHAEADVERALKKVGWRIRKRGLTTTQFYFSRLVEAVPAK
ncbi:magnesium protoporphyrin IX methyltransferase [Pyrus ussuriensis x Pyrus communis]|uniref:Magnesium protoporphyrin IX methyltransferase n=1 Tax=Pyrus ussuriensis x Pyrus communis TaxID=2448454 RepID=A0A5N5G0W9_9ROSA|nr:magnesium protoporphyrin IX methyltransferase [Pyrus ussuriensis x Pyrus communis]